MSIRDTYNAIAKDFDRTRYAMWSCMEHFYETHKPGYILDVGCGNGKNILPGMEISYELCDICDEFVKMTSKRYDNAGMVQLDAISLSYRNTIFDTVISVAVLHHLDTFSKRAQMLNEMIRVCKDDGVIFFTVWADEKSCDKMVPWTNVKTKNVTYRFYHFFDESEVLSLLHHCSITDYNVVLSHNNYVCTIRK